MGIYDRDYYRRETSGSLWVTGQTPVTLGLVVTNVAVFVLQMLSDAGRPSYGLMEALELAPRQLFDDWQVWRLLTATFCHVGVWHIAGNMLFLWWFGREMERFYGSRDFLAFYLIAGIVSSFCWASASRLAGTEPHMVGASGAVTAVLVLYTLYYPRERIYFYGIFPIEMRWLVLLYLAEDAYGLLGPTYSPVAHLAHLSGAAFGLLFKFGDLRVTRLFSVRRSRPRLRVVAPQREPELTIEREPAATPLDEHLEHEMDQVLAKIAREGPESLTDGERSILDRASRQLRKGRD